MPVTHAGERAARPAETRLLALAPGGAGRLRVPDLQGREARVAPRDPRPVRRQRRGGAAARSVEEGLDETLTRHRLGVFPELGRRFKTTNLIETVKAELERKSLEVDHRRTSDESQPGVRWPCSSSNNRSGA